MGKVEWFKQKILLLANTIKESKKEDTQIKIIFISFYSGVINRGVETFTHELANNLVRLGNDVVVYQVGNKLNNTKYEVKQIATQVNWKSSDTSHSILRKFYLDYWSIKIFQFSMDVISDIIRSDVDIVFPLNGGWQSILIRFIALIKGAKMVVAGQSGPGQDDKLNLFTFPNAFVGFTDYQCKWAKGVNKQVRVEKIPNGIDLEKFKKTGAKLSTKLKKPIVLVCAALVPIKRVDLTIKAVTQLGNASLLVVGDGEQYEYLNALGKELLNDRFEIRKLDYTDMPKVYRLADVFAFSTQPWESFGIVMLEAMANNLPIVASDDPIRSEIIGKAGITVDVTDIDKYADALDKALSRDWKNIPISQATKYSWDEISKKYNDLFQSLVQKS